MTNSATRFIFVSVAILIVAFIVMKWQVVTDYGYDKSKNSVSDATVTLSNLRDTNSMIGTEVRDWIRRNVDNTDYVILVKTNDSEVTKTIDNFDDIRDFDSDCFVNSASFYNCLVINGTHSTTIQFNEEVIN